MNKLILIAVLLCAPVAQADLYFPKFFTQKCAMLNDDLDEYGNSWEEFSNDMLTGYLSGISLMLYAGEDAKMYVPDEEGVQKVFVQTVFLHCRNNPADAVYRAASEGVKAVRKPKGEPL